MKIALLEDEENSASIVIEWLEDAGHSVVWFNTGKDCLMAMPEGHFDLCLFDWMLPDIDGPEVMSCLSMKGSTPPIIFLTGRDAAEDVEQVMQAGASDYLVKPSNKKMLLARINAVSLCFQTSPIEIGSFGDLRVDFNLRQFEIEGRPIELTEKESLLALYFFNRVDALISRSSMIQEVWGSNMEIDLRTLDAHVSLLRRKLKLIAENGWRLISVYQQWYRLERI